eukprot:jgi/Botrbrau1/23341/Bobra.0051s0001.1
MDQNKWFSQAQSPLSRTKSPLTNHMEASGICPKWHLSSSTDPGWGTPTRRYNGYDSSGNQVVMLLGALRDPSYDASSNKLTFTAQILNTEDQLARANGVTNYVQAGKGGQLLTDPPSGPLSKVAIMVDLAINPTTPGNAVPTMRQELDRLRYVQSGRRGPFVGRGAGRG